MDQPVHQCVIPWAVVLDLEHPDSIYRGLTAPPNEGRVSSQLHQRHPPVHSSGLVIWQRDLRGGQDVRGGGFRGRIPASARAVCQMGHCSHNELHPSRGFSCSVGSDTGEVSWILHGGCIDLQASISENQRSESWDRLKNLLKHTKMSHASCAGSCGLTFTHEVQYTSTLAMDIKSMPNIAQKPRKFVT